MGVNSRSVVVKISKAQMIVEAAYLPDHQDLPKTGFYVYALLENNVVCYIGKGSKNRVLQHFKGSTNQLLASRLRDNEASFKWLILECFSDEYECIEYETELIQDCRECKHRLYNKVHYSSNNQLNEYMRFFMWTFKRYENFVYKDQTDQGLWHISKSVDVLFYLIERTVELISQYRMPTYKGVPIDQLGYFISSEIYNHKIVERVNICHKTDVASMSNALRYK